MSNKIKQGDIVTIKKGSTVINSSGVEVDHNPELDGYDINDTTIHTMPLKALICEYLEYYPEYTDIAINRLVSELPMTFLFFKYPNVSGIRSAPEFITKALFATDNTLDIVALNNALTNSTAQFMAFADKYNPEFYAEHKEGAIALLAENSGYDFLCSYRESHPQLVPIAIANAVKKEPFGLALNADIYIADYPAEVMKAIETIATNNYELYLEEFSSRYPQFISN